MVKLYRFFMNINTIHFLICEIDWEQLHLFFNRSQFKRWNSILYFMLKFTNREARALNLHKINQKYQILMKNLLYMMVPGIHSEGVTLTFSLLSVYDTQLACDTFCNYVHRCPFFLDYGLNLPDCRYSNLSSIPFLF